MPKKVKVDKKYVAQAYHEVDQWLARHLPREPSRHENGIIVLNKSDKAILTQHFFLHPIADASFLFKIDNVLNHKVTVDRNTHYTRRKLMIAIRNAHHDALMLEADNDTKDQHFTHVVVDTLNTLDKGFKFHKTQLEERYGPDSDQVRKIDTLIEMLGDNTLTLRDRVKRLIDTINKSEYEGLFEQEAQANQDNHTKIPLYNILLLILKLISSFSNSPRMFENNMSKCEIDDTLYKLFDSVAEFDTTLGIGAVEVDEMIETSEHSAGL